MNYDPLEIARTNPVLAYAMYVLQMPLVPREYTLQISYSVAGATGAQLTATFPQFFQNAAIIKCAYVYAVSNAWAANIFYAWQQNHQNNRLPFNCHVEVTGGGVSNKAIILARRLTDTPVPVNTMFASMSSPTNQCNSALKGVVVNARQNIRLTTWSTRAILAAEIPFVLNFTFSVDEIDGCDLCQCSNMLDADGGLAKLNEAVRNSVTTSRGGSFGVGI